jgi:hypothetical protein
MNRRGQFFSPDMAIAVLLLLAIIVFFSLSFDYIKNRVSFFDDRRMMDESSHAVMNSLVYSIGDPKDWEEYSSLADINSIGLAEGASFLSEKKVRNFFSFLDSNYAGVKDMLALGRNDFFMELVDFNGEVIDSAGVIASDYSVKSAYSRIVFYNNRQCTLRGVFSYAE